MRGEGVSESVPEAMKTCELSLRHGCFFLSLGMRIRGAGSEEEDDEISWSASEKNGEDRSSEIVGD